MKGGKFLAKKTHLKEDIYLEGLDLGDFSNTKINRNWQLFSWESSTITNFKSVSS